MWLGHLLAAPEEQGGDVPTDTPMGREEMSLLMPCCNRNSYVSNGIPHLFQNSTGQVEPRARCQSRDAAAVLPVAQHRSQRLAAAGPCLTCWPQP